MNRLAISTVLCLILVGSSQLGAQQGSPSLPTEQAAPSQDQAELQRRLQVAGYRTGLYTSPHLDRIEERISELEKQVRELTEQVRVLESRALDMLLKNGKASGGAEAPKAEAPKMVRFYLKNAQAEYVRPILHRLLLTGEGRLNATIMSDERTNSILAKGQPKELAIIEALVKRFE